MIQLPDVCAIEEVLSGSFGAESLPQTLTIKPFPNMKAHQNSPFIFET